MNLRKSITAVALLAAGIGASLGAGSAQAIVAPQATFNPTFSLQPTGQNSNYALKGSVSSQSNIPSRCTLYVFNVNAIDAVNAQVSADNSALQRDQQVGDLSPALRNQVLFTGSTPIIDPSSTGVFPTFDRSEPRAATLVRCTLDNDGEGPAQGRSYAQRLSSDAGAGLFGSSGAALDQFDFLRQFFPNAR